MTGTINSEFQTKVKLISKYTCLTWFVSRKLSASKYIGKKKYYKQIKILIKSFYRYIYIWLFNDSVNREANRLALFNYNVLHNDY